MIETLMAFLGGNAFRLLFGEISSAWTKWQDHKHELAMLQAQASAQAAARAVALAGPPWATPLQTCWATPPRQPDPRLRPCPRPRRP